jgi:inorganic pyrophosphatase/exopolyphosphatase
MYVIGHKNPGTDSIVSALAYAEFWRLQGEQHVIAARQGEDKIREQPVGEMKDIRIERGFASFLFMVVDVVHGETEILIVGMEQQVAETFGLDLASPHSITLGGIMSRKRQVVPVLPRVARQRRARG